MGHGLQRRVVLRSFSQRSDICIKYKSEKAAPWRAGCLLKRGPRSLISGYGVSFYNPVGFPVLYVIYLLKKNSIFH